MARPRLAHCASETSLTLSERHLSGFGVYRDLRA
jgi:hypothetical protein